MATIGEPTNARSRRTRQGLLAAAQEIITEGGFGALTMSAVAERAGVTRRSLYLHFPNRAALVGALFDAVAASEGLEASIERVWSAPDAVSALDEWAAHLARYHSRVLAIDRAVEAVWRQDPDAASHRSRVVAEKLANARRLATWLAEDGELSSAWTTRSAADMLFALISSDVVEALLVDRGWSRRRLASHLRLLLRATFTDRRSA